jgi:hypothetical protein
VLNAQIVDVIRNPRSAGSISQDPHVLLIHNYLTII